MNKRLSEYLTVSKENDKSIIRCAKCQHPFCEATENCKHHALMREVAPSQRGELYAPSKRFVFREFYCPQCGTMFDTEIRLRGQPFVWDASLKI